MMFTQHDPLALTYTLFRYFRTLLGTLHADVVSQANLRKLQLLKMKLQALFQVFGSGFQARMREVEMLLNET
jgi:hypothetical protein